MSRTHKTERGRTPNIEHIACNDEEWLMTGIKVDRGTFDKVMVPVFAPANFVPDR